MPDEFYQKALHLLAQGHIGEAIAALEHAIEEGRETAAIAKLLAKLSLRIDEVRAFQNWCHEALRMDENDLEVYTMLEAYFRENGRDYEADEVKEAALGVIRRGGGDRSSPED
ncbi:MAG: hypothetical protein K7J46_02145 [Bryobacter sp.]|jgi:tetratricopeptide (TPR) repeat protein|nr:hypothetical protein [Bryobacter sp. CoA8 C33]